MNNIQVGIEEALDLAAAADQSSTIIDISKAVNTLKGVVGEDDAHGLRYSVG
jgi:hypothetical protein